MKLSKLLQKFYSVADELTSLTDRIERLQEAVGRLEMRQLEQLQSKKLNEYEFQVFSQWGEDGIIQFLVKNISIKNKVFIEFGVGDYSESNTRFLLKNQNWSGLVIDGSKNNIKKIRQQSNLVWKYDLKAENAFITRNNINQLISKNNICGDIGILSIDIDGNDYWVWDSINCISPRIVVCEYNSLFGYKRAVTTPYDQNFMIHKAHFSGLYWGASVAAFDHLAKQKGYSLVGSNSEGNNIFFVRNDVLGDIPAYTPEQAYVKSKFRISRSQTGELSFLDFESGLEVMQDMPLYDVSSDNLIQVRDLMKVEVDV